MRGTGGEMVNVEFNEVVKGMYISGNKKRPCDRQEYIEMVVDESALDQVADWFWKDVKQ